MAGHFGVDGVSIKNLEVILIDKENSLLTLKGGVPGYNGSLLVIEKIGHLKGHTPAAEEVVTEKIEEQTEESVEPVEVEETEVLETPSEQTETVEQPVEEVTTEEAL